MIELNLIGGVRAVKYIRNVLVLLNDDASCGCCYQYAHVDKQF